MKAFVQSWRDWSNDQSYPVLIVEADKQDQEQCAALKALEGFCKGIPGRGYLKQMAAVDNLGHLVIDLGTLLTMVGQIQSHERSVNIGIGWLKSTVAAKQKEWNPKKSEILCLCGSIFKSEKLRAKHIRKCSVVKEQMPLLRRAKISMLALQGRKVKASGTSKARKLQDSKAARLQAQVSAKAKVKGTEQSKVERGAKARRIKRQASGARKRKA